MSELDFTNIIETSINTPSAGVTALFIDTNRRLRIKLDSGAVNTIVPRLRNASIASQSPFSSDTYLTGSSIALGPSPSPLQANTVYRCLFDVTKTAAGTATPIITVRFGTNGTITDAALFTFTFNAQTAVVDTGMFDIKLTFRAVGTTDATIQGVAILNHNLSITGLSSVNPHGWQQVIVTSGVFDSTVVNSTIGLSVNGGASAAWTVSLVQTDLLL